MEEVRTFLEKVKADIDAGKTEDEIFQWLLPHLGKQMEIDASLAESLARVSHPVSARLLQRIMEASDEKQVRKVIKRSLYRMKSKGIPVEEMPIPGEKPVLRPAAVEPPMGFGGGIDFLGQRLVLLGIPRPGRGLIVIQGIISDTQGLVAFSGGEIRRKGFKAFLGEVQEGSPFPLVEMEAPYGASLLTKAYQLALDKGGTPPQEYLHLRPEIERIKREYEHPLIYDCFRGADSVDPDRWLARSGDLLNSELFRGWKIEDDQIRPYAEAVREAGESKIVLTKTQKEARVQEIYGKALFEHFSDERRILYKGRLEEMAYVLLKLGRQEEAKISLAAAIDLEKVLNVFQPNPFLLQLVIKSISMFLAQRDQERARESSWIVKP
jgi:hypothetical protein